jgi:hypothetical protein
MAGTLLIRLFTEKGEYLKYSPFLLKKKKVNVIIVGVYILLTERRFLNGQST